MKNVVISLCFALVVIVTVHVAKAQEYSPGYNNSYSNSMCGRAVFNDKLVQPHDAMMNWYGGGCWGPSCWFIPKGRFVGHGGGMYGKGSGMQGYPYYYYRGPRDFLNPNPPSIGY